MDTNNKSIKIPVLRRLGTEDLPLPYYMTLGAAGVDLCAAIDSNLILKPGERALVPTGLSIALPVGYEGQIRPRSGLALRHGVTVLNAPGTIDSDYRGEIQVILINLGQEDFPLRRGERVAQMVIAPVTKVEWEEVGRLDETRRGAGGFGHTGT